MQGIPTLKAKTPLDVADALRVAADAASDLLESLSIANEDMRNASSGLLPDGTPVADMLENLKEERADNAKLRDLLRRISSVALDCKASEYGIAIKTIRELSRTRF